MFTYIPKPQCSVNILVHDVYRTACDSGTKSTAISFKRVAKLSTSDVHVIPKPMETISCINMQKICIHRSYFISDMMYATDVDKSIFECNLDGFTVKNYSIHRKR